MSPAGCNYSAIWSLKRESDDLDMLEAFPAIFSLSSEILALSSVEVGSVDVESLLGRNTYNLVGTLNDTAGT